MGLFRHKHKDEGFQLPEGFIPSPVDWEELVPVEMVGEIAEAYPQVQLLTLRDRPPRLFVGVRVEAVEAEVEREADRMAAAMTEAEVPGQPMPYYEEAMKPVVVAAFNNPENWIGPDGLGEGETFELFELNPETGRIGN